MAKIAGRILRQLDAAKTGIAAPDECYVITPYNDFRSCNSRKG